MGAQEIADLLQIMRGNIVFILFFLVVFFAFLYFTLAANGRKKRLELIYRKIRSTSCNEDDAECIISHLSKKEAILYLNNRYKKKSIITITGNRIIDNSIVLLVPVVATILIFAAIIVGMTTWLER